jgi:hypothetical protein
MQHQVFNKYKQMQGTARSADWNIGSKQWDSLQIVRKPGGRQQGTTRIRRGHGGFQLRLAQISTVHEARVADGSSRIRRLGNRRVWSCSHCQWTRRNAVGMPRQPPRRPGCGLEPQPAEERRGGGSVCNVAEPHAHRGACGLDLAVGLSGSCKMLARKRTG